MGKPRDDGKDEIPDDNHAGVKGGEQATSGGVSGTDEFKFDPFNGKYVVMAAHVSVLGVGSLLAWWGALQ